VQRRQLLKASQRQFGGFLVSYLSFANRGNFLITTVVLCLLAGPAFGVVTHPSQGELTVDDSLESVLGRWQANNPSYGNASCVAVQPNYIITTRHQGYTSTATVSFEVDGTIETYKVVDKITNPTADFMVVQVANLDGTAANLTNYVSLYQANNERNQDVVIGGYGKTAGDPYGTGYYWAGSANDTLTWGTNRVNSTGTAANGTMTSNVLVANFSAAGSGTVHEASIAEWDSGGGWFINADDEWLVAGLNAYVSYHTDPYGDPYTAVGDTLKSIRVSSYADWIIFNSTVDGDADLDWDVDDEDLNLLLFNFGTESGATWAMGDFNGDEAVDDSDLNLLLSNFGYGTGGTSGANPPVPEPGTLALLGVGAAGLLARRRKR